MNSSSKALATDISIAQLQPHHIEILAFRASPASIHGILPEASTEFSTTTVICFQ
jgi:hypothetical protein